MEVNTITKRQDRPCIRCGQLMRAPHWRRTRCEPCQEAHGREYRRAYAKGYMRARRKYDPHCNSQHAASMREKRATDPDFAERQRESMREWRQHKRTTDPAFAAAEQARFEKIRART